MLDEWSAQTAATYELTEYAVPSAGEPLAEAIGLSEASSTGAAPDLFVFPINRASALVAADVLASIPPERQAGEELNWLDVFQGVRENVASYEREPVVVPFSCPALVCYYRSDLLEKAGLQPPATWEDYSTLMQSLAEWAPGMSAVEPWGEEYRATMFLARAAAYAKHPANYSVFFDIQSGEPLVATPPFLRALEESMAAISLMPGEVQSYTPRDCRREFFSGRAALAIAFETGPAGEPLPFGPNGDRASSDGTSTADKRLEDMRAGFCRLPGSREIFNFSTEEWEPARDNEVNHVTLTAFAGLCAGVSQGSPPERRQAAWNLLAVLTTNRTEQAFPPATVGPCREQQAANAAAWVGRELTVAEGFEYAQAVTESLRDRQLIAELPVPERHEFRAALTDGLGPALEGSRSAAESLDAVESKWRAIVDESGTDEIVNDYRRALGLSPRTMP